MKLPNIFASQTKPLKFRRGDVVFAAGDEGDLMFVVTSGEVEIQVDGHTVETVTEDGFFGEMALIEGGPWSATAVAASDCSLVPINEKRFEFMVHEVPSFAMHIMRGLSRRLRAIDSAQG